MEGVEQRRAALAPHTGQRDHRQARVPTELEPPREGIKEATKTPPQKDQPGGALAKKLEARRAQELNAPAPSALHPFRVQTTPIPEGAAAVFGTAQASALVPEEAGNLLGGLVDDDYDEDLEATEE